MRIRSNFWFAAAAVLLGAYVWWVERRAGPSVAGPGGARATFPPIPAEEFVELELSVSNRVMALQRSTPSAPWSLRSPVVAAVNPEPIRELLRALGDLRPATYLGPTELAAAGGTASFGLTPGSTTRLTGKTAQGTPVILNLGAKTLGGTRFYLQRVGDPGVFVVDRALLDALPTTADDWRDRALVTLPRDGFDRLEIRGDVEFRAERDVTGRWRLKRPLDARADSERLNTLLALLTRVSVDRFVADRPIADRETYGLQKPVLELTLGRGAQDLVQLQFGVVQTNEPGLRYVWRQLSTNLVTVPANVLEPWLRPLADFRDRRLLPDVSAATVLEFSGPAGARAFRVERTNALSTNWWVTAPGRFRAEPTVMSYFLRQFGFFEIVDFPADVVTDLGRLGLAAPERVYRLSAGTNVLAQLSLGSRLTNRPTLLHARRADESAVYALPISILGQLADAAAVLRDWRFASSNVARVIVRRRGETGELVRTNGGWNSPRGRLDEIAAGNLNATLDGLGALTSNRGALTDPRDEQRLRRNYRIQEIGRSVTVELRPGSPESFASWTLEFGGEFGADHVVLARFDDDPTPLRLQVPAILFVDALRDLTW